MPADTLRPGDRVHDRDDPEPDDAIVVNQPAMTASEWEVEPRDCTLADDNPDYPDDVAVTVVCFVDALIEYGPPFDPTEQQPLSLDTLHESGVHFYTFPAPRLTVIESPAIGLPDTATTEDDESKPETETTAAEATAETAEPVGNPTDGTEASETDSDETDDTADSEETDPSPSPELTQLKTTLEAEGLAVTIEDTETLTIERLGQTYQITPDGAIDGDGALRSQLETIVDNAI